MTVPMLTGAVSLVATIAGSAWWLSEELHSKADAERVNLVEAKSNFAIDIQIEDLLARINRLEAKPNKTQDDYKQIEYWRKELDRMRRIRESR